MDSPYFSEIVQRLLKSWPAVDLAMKEMSGGFETIEKFEDLIEVILKFFRSRKARIYDLEDLLESTMDEKLNILVDDGSCQLIAEELFEAYEECMEGNGSDFLQEVKRKLGAVVPIIKRENLESSDESDSHDDVDNSILSNSAHAPNTFNY
uniref:Pre-rRNA-processing protein TSR2 homolog n=1 Tax=Myxobolus squamalis TaxID=59785 RepID=A0A6B2FXD0_MYXSQ